MIGKTYGELEVLGRDPDRMSPCHLKCRCKCGRETSVYKGSIISGATTSCGFHHAEKISRIKTTHGHTKGRGWTPEYAIWCTMLSRCSNPKTPHYADYGGRGIIVCEEWKEFSCFLRDMGNRPSNKHSIDRFPNNNGNYEPGNCRWATSGQQSRNKRSNLWIEFNGRSQVLMDWAKELNMSHGILWHRICVLKMSPEVAFTTPVKKRGQKRE